MPPSPTPVGPPRLALRTAERTGSCRSRRLSPAALAAAGASFRPLVAGLAASRRLGIAPAWFNDEGSKPYVKFRGSITRPQCSLSTLRRPPHDDTTQDSLAAGGQPLLRGIAHPQGSIKVSTTTTWLPPLQASPGAINEFTMNIARVRDEAPEPGAENRNVA
jgi:hypothetical protein